MFGRPFVPTYQAMTRGVRQRSRLTAGGRGVAPKYPNGFMSSLSAADFGVLRPHLKPAEWPQGHPLRVPAELVPAERRVNVQEVRAVHTDGPVFS
jgi:hypothetical protein